MQNSENPNDIFEEIRRIKRSPDIQLIEIRNESQEITGYLKPLTKQDLNNNSLISDFVEWRNRDRSGWLDQRTVDDDGTSKWLGNLLNDDSRIAFLIYDAQMNLIGRIGALDITDTEAMTDSMLRGRLDIAPGIITHACRSMFAWLFRNSGIDHIKSKIVEGNEPSLRLHDRLGFEIHCKKRLRLENTERGPVLTEICDATDSTDGEKLSTPDLFIMKLSRNRFMTRFNSAK